MIADANKHDDGHLESYIRRRMSSQAESDIQAGVSAMKEYIETAPDILEQIE